MDRWNDGPVELDVVAHELYGLAPDEFTAARNARARQLAAAGDRPLAAEVRKLPKPSMAAWLVNALVRRSRPEILELLDLGPELRQALGRGAREEVRRLSDRRQELIRLLVGAASAMAAEAGHSMGPLVQRQLEGTLEAGVADETAAGAIHRGTLDGPLSFVGFAALSPGDEGTAPPRPGRRGAQERPDRESAAAERRRAEAAALGAAAEQRARRRAELESAEASVQELSRRLDEASDRQRRAAANLREAERAKAQAAEALRLARRSRAQAERNAREADRARSPGAGGRGSPPRRGA